jgi:hypothetical protein
MMRIRELFVGRCAAGLLFAGAAVLAPAPVAAQDAAPETSYDFDDDLVTGDLVRPDGDLLTARRGGPRASLIRVRESFVPEMLKSVEDL